MFVIRTGFVRTGSQTQLTGTVIASVFQTGKTLSQDGADIGSVPFAKIGAVGEDSLWTRTNGVKLDRLTAN